MMECSLVGAQILHGQRSAIRGLLQRHVLVTLAAATQRHPGV